MARLAASGRRTDAGADPIARLVFAGFAVAVLAVAFQSAAHFAYMFLFDARVGEFNVHAENNAFSWISSVTTFVVACLLTALAALSRQKRRRLLLVAALVALFSLDDAVQLHENLGDRVNAGLGLSSALAHATWPVLFLPLLALVFVVLWQVMRDGPASVRSTVGTALGLLAVGVAAEALAAPLYAAGHDFETFVGAVQIVIEEGAELAGWMLLATGLAGSVFASIYAIGWESGESARAGGAPGGGRARLAEARSGAGASDGEIRPRSRWPDGNARRA